MIREVRVIANAKKERVEENVGGTLRVWLTVPRVQNKANERLVVVLAKWYKTKRRCVKIIKGHMHTKKVVEIISNTTSI